MSRYHPVRPKQQKPEPAPQTDASEKYRKAVEEAANALYIERHGATLDAALKRVEGTLALYDREVERMTGDDSPAARWRISPSTALQWQREQTRLLERKDALKEECWKLAKRLVDDWMQAKQTPTPQQATHGAPSATQANADDAPEEGSQADAKRKAG